MFSKHREWIITVGNGYAKIVADSYDEVRQIAFKKFGQDKCKFFYPLNTDDEQKLQWKNMTRHDLQTAESIIEKYKLKEVE